MPEKFIADAMLGRLARWLRLLGFDTLYFPGISDRALLKLALNENRYILTRDSHFKAMRLERCLIIESEKVDRQLRQVMAELHPALPPEPRCPTCNSQVEGVSDKSEIMGSVPEYVYLNFSKFRRCQGCGNVYWEGSHFRDFTRRLGEALEKRNDGPDQ